MRREPHVRVAQHEHDDCGDHRDHDDGGDQDVRVGGFTLTGNGQGGVNIAFVKGPYYYLVGQELAASESVHAAIAALSATAAHLYHRVSS